MTLHHEKTYQQFASQPEQLQQHETYPASQPEAPTDQPFMEQAVLRTDDSVVFMAPKPPEGHVRTIGMVIPKTGDVASDAPALTILDIRSLGVQDRYKRGTHTGVAIKAFANSDYIVVGPKADFEDGTGYTELAPAAPSATYGTSPRGDRDIKPAQRFSVTITEAGLEVTDLGSAEGTVVLAFEGAGRQLSRIVQARGQASTEIKYESKIEGLPDKAHQLSNGETNLYVRNFSARAKTGDAMAFEAMGKDNCLLAPIAALEPGNGMEYAVSRIAQGSRKHAVVYVQTPKGEMIPRLAYKSHSGGGWRITPDTGVGGHVHYSKGSDNADGGYTQLTKPAEQLERLLEAIDGSEKGQVMLESGELSDLLNVFSAEKQLKAGHAYFDKEVRGVRLPAHVVRGMYDAYSPGEGYVQDAPEARHALETMQLPDGFEPAFDGPYRTYTLEHPLAGPSDIRVYQAALGGEPIEWHVAENGNGFAWVDRITFKHDEMGTYGTPKRVILAGALSAKPYDYKHQVDDMEPGKDYLPDPDAGDYVSLQPMFERMPWYRRYQEVRRREDQEVMTMTRDRRLGGLAINGPTTERYKH